MDAEKRKKAKLIIQEANNLTGVRRNNEQAIPKYLAGINLIMEIIEKSVADFETMYGAYEDIAIISFNTAKYANAAQYYSKAIEQLLQMPLSDNTCRNLIKQYINLADSCNELLNHPAARAAIENSIIAFEKIKAKSPSELSLGNPRINFAAFYDYFEQQVSGNSYLRSAKFKNNAVLQREEQLARQQENQFAQMFSVISIPDSPKKQIDIKLDGMIDQLSQLGIKPQQPQQIFGQVRIDQSPDEDDYRHSAMRYLNLARQHNQNELVQDAVAAFGQAIEAFSLIRQQQAQDLETIKELAKEVDLLLAQRNKKIHPTQQRAASSAPSVAFFAPPIELIKVSEFTYDADPEEEEETDVDRMYI